jgi:hypothetical protein
MFAEWDTVSCGSLTIGRLKGEVEGFSPVHDVQIPHKHKAGLDKDTLPVFFQVPDSATKEKPVPAVIIMTGLDGFRTELCVWAEGWRRNGVALIVMEIPGTGDSPADPKDPKSPDRQWSTLFDWIDTQNKIDSKKLCAWGFSTGGYYTTRAAYTHHDRLLGSVNLGGGVHHMFDPEWLNEVNHLEYPFECVSYPASKYKLTVSVFQAHSLISGATETISSSSRRKPQINSRC